MSRGRAYRVHLSNDGGPANLFELLAALEAALPTALAESTDAYERYAAEQALREVQRLRIVVPDFINGVRGKPERWWSLVYEAAVSGFHLGTLAAQINASSAFGNLVQRGLKQRAALSRKRYVPSTKATPEQIRAVLRTAASNKDAARKLRVSLRTVTNYKKKYAQR